MLGDTWFSFLQDGQKSASPNWPKQASKDQMLAKKIEDPYFKWFMHSFIFLTHPPPPLHLLILSERRLRKVSVLICQCQGSSGSQLTGVRDILEKSVSNDVFLTFLFFFFTVLISSTKQTLSAVDTFISFLHLLIKGPLTHMSLVASRGSSSPPLRAQREGWPTGLSDVIGRSS